jgi:hypothetical protein
MGFKMGGWPLLEDIEMSKSSTIVQGMGLALSIVQILDEERLASGISDEEFHKLAKPEGRVLIRKFVQLLAENTPKNFTKNQHGHYVVTVTGLDLTGAEESSRLESKGFRIGTYARQILTSTKSDSYDRNHRLEAGRKYQVVLVPGREVRGKRTTADLQAYAKKFGYAVPKAGIIPRVREGISDEQMKEMDIWYIAGLHDPIKDSGGFPSVLDLHRYADGSWLRARWGNPANEWGDGGAFAFLAPQVSA